MVDRQTRKRAHQRALDTLRPLLKPGDRIRATRGECHARPANYVFAGWDGEWIVTASGINTIAPASVTAVNGQFLRDPQGAAPTARYVNAGTEGRLIRVLMDAVRRDPQWRAVGPVERFRDASGTVLRQRIERYPRGEPSRSRQPADGR